jgi:hypothetical protein
MLIDHTLAEQRQLLAGGISASVFAKATEVTAQAQRVNEHKQ